MPIMKVLVLKVLDILFVKILRTVKEEGIFQCKVWLTNAKQTKVGHKNSSWDKYIKKMVLDKNVIVTWAAVVVALEMSQWNVKQKVL